MGYSFSLHYTSISAMFGLGLFLLWLLLAGHSLRELPSRAILTITGHLRARPKPWLEYALRTTFTEFDRELSVILQDRSAPGCPWTDQSAKPAPAVGYDSLAGPAEPPLPDLL